MDDILSKIIEVEKECAERISANLNDHDAAIGGLRTQIEARRKAEMKRIAAENGERYKREVDAAEGEIARELSEMKDALGGLRGNKELCDEVRERILSILF